MAKTVEIEVPGAVVAGELAIPRRAVGIVLFVHGSGAGRRSHRDRLIAARLRAGSLATLHVDVAGEPAAAFELPVLARRVSGVTDWLAADPSTRHLPIGYLATGKGAALALIAAAARPELVAAVVARGGRPDLAGPALGSVAAATLLVVGGRDAAVVGLNRRALARLGGPKRLVIAPGAGQSFDGRQLDAFSRLARTWLRSWLVPEETALAAARGGI
jgi:putative phosphoribosyl transferase